MTNSEITRRCHCHHLRLLIVTSNILQSLDPGMMPTPTFIIKRNVVLGTKTAIGTLLHRCDEDRVTALSFAK